MRATRDVFREVLNMTPSAAHRAAAKARGVDADVMMRLLVQQLETMLPLVDEVELERKRPASSPSLN
jgi:hypothetical protein